MAYTTATLVKNLIKTNYDSTSDLTDARIAVLIAEVDGTIDSALAGVAWPFNASDSATYKTPKIIGRCSQYLSAAEGVRELTLKNASADLAAFADYLEAKGREFLSEVKNAGGSTAPETTSTETLVFGSSSSTYPWRLNEYEAYLAATTPLDCGEAPNIFPRTVRCLATSTVAAGSDFTAAQLARARLGVEFTVYPHPEYRAWIFQANDSRLYSDTTTLNVSYQWNYQKWYGSTEKMSGRLSVL